MRLKPIKNIFINIVAICIVFFGVFFRVSTFAVYRNYDNVFYCNKNTEMKISLTFDDGPHPKYTPIILDILSEYNIKATFFIVGENASQYPEIVERIYREGHEIGNHTYSHPHLSNLTQGALCKEIERCEDSLLEICDSRPKLFRPPEGVVEKNIGDLTKKMDYSIILWSIDTMDWALTPSEKIEKNVMTNINSGDIILMHDYISMGESPTPQALRNIIPKLIEKGYKFVTISELIGVK
jgi:polysaccharide deacetylase family sporulation protein PdaB